MVKHRGSQASSGGLTYPSAGRVGFLLLFLVVLVVEVFRDPVPVRTHLARQFGEIRSFFMPLFQTWWGPLAVVSAVALVVLLIDKRADRTWNRPGSDEYRFAAEFMKAKAGTEMWFYIAVAGAIAFIHALTSGLEELSRQHPRWYAQTTWQRFVATGVVIGLGLGLFELRKRNLLVYAILEIGFGFFACYYGISKGAEGTGAVAEKILAGAYLIVRGRDNVDRARDEKAKEERERRSQARRSRLPHARMSDGDRRPPSPVLRPSPRRVRATPCHNG